MARFRSELYSCEMISIPIGIVSVSGIDKEQVT